MPKWGEAELMKWKTKRILFLIPPVLAAVWLVANLLVQPLEAASNQLYFSPEHDLGAVNSQ